MDPKAVLDLLRTLDAVGARVTELRAELERLPAEIAKWTDLLESRSTAADELRAERKQKDDRRLQCERDVERIEAARERSRNNMERVADERQAAALEAELESLANQLDERETEAIELLEEIDEIDGRIGEAKDRVIMAERALDHAKSQAESNVPRLETELAESLAEGDRLLEQLPAEVKKLFLRARGKTGKPALAPTDNGACGRCQMVVPRQRINEALAFKDFHSCPHCEAMLDPWAERERKLEAEADDVSE